MRKRLLLFALLPAVACRGLALQPDQTAELERLIEEAKAKNEPLEAHRKEAILAARGQIGPRPDLGPCPVGVAMHDPDDAGSFADGEITFQLSASPISVVHAKDFEKSESPRWDRVQAGLVNDIQSMLYHQYRGTQADIDEGFARAKELADPAWLSIDATLVIDRWKEPAVTGDTFQSGSLVGRFYVYDYTKEQIVCAASVYAENSDNIGVHIHQDDAGRMVGAKSDLVRDLYRNAVKEGIEGLAVAGPIVFSIAP